MICPINLYCIEHGELLTPDEDKHVYRGKCSCTFDIINGIPRFVPLDNYASSFGVQWNEFRSTQLDSFTGLSISKDRLKRLLGGSLDIVKDKKVLEAGCGAGRFTEILLNARANVFAIDISTAVDANYKNCSKYQGYYIIQGNITRLPIKTEEFDIVICIGVIQHTPNPEETIRVLCSYVAPGGSLIIDHYTYGYPVTLSRRIIRSFLIKMPNSFSMSFCKSMTKILWPLHKFLWNNKNLPLINSVRSLFLRLSPIVDYHDAYPQLGEQLLFDWAMLDTHDTLTDHYKHLRSAEDIYNCLTANGMREIVTVYAGNGVEARAKKPKSIP